MRPTSTNFNKLLFNSWWCLINTTRAKKMEHGSKDWTARKSRDLKISQKQFCIFQAFFNQVLENQLKSKGEISGRQRMMCTNIMAKRNAKKTEKIFKGKRDHTILHQKKQGNRNGTNARQLSRRYLNQEYGNLVQQLL